MSKKTFTNPLRYITILSLIFIGSGIICGEDQLVYTITFANSAKSATAISNSTNNKTVIESASQSYVTDQPFTVNKGNCYYGDKQDCIRLGKSNNAAELQIALSDAGKIKASKIVVNCKYYNSTNKGTLSVNNANAQNTPETAGNLTFEINSDITSIILTTTLSTYIYSISIYKNVETPTNNITSIEISGNLAKSEYYVGDTFNFDGLTATGTYTNNNNEIATEDITNAITWSIEPASLTTDISTVTVKATLSDITGSKDYAIIVKEKTAPIIIANMDLFLNDKSIDISAQTNPTYAGLTFEITEGSEYVTMTDGKLSAKASGTAKITASYEGTEEYSSAAESFNVTVKDIAQITWNLTKATYSFASTDEVKWTDDAVSMVAAKAKAGTSTNNYLGGSNTSTRFYKNSTLTLTPVIGVTLCSITYTATTEGYAKALANSAWTNATATANGNIVTITPNDGTKTMSATIGGTTGSTSIVITFTGERAHHQKTITARKVATMYLPYSVAIPTAETDTPQVKAYIATGETNNTITLKKINGGVIPANTGVILYADIESSTKYDFILTEQDCTEDLQDNLLKGVEKSTPYDDVIETGKTNYALVADGDKSVKFARVNGGKYAAYSAYLQLPSDNAVKNISLNFDDNDITTVSSIKTTGTLSENKAYNLSGQTVATDYKGIIIKKGRMYINR